MLGTLGHIKRLRDEKHALVLSFNDEKTLFKASRNAALGFLKTLAPVLDIRSDPI